jgi:hypothetical protein
MKSYPEDEGDRKELENLNAEPWMVECLKLNPEYVYWGVGDDYMHGVPENKDEGGWDSGKRFETWKDFGPWKLDDLNEVVHFFFEINRESENCPTCARTGYHPDAHWVEKSWYKHSSPFTVLTTEEQAIQDGMKRMFGSRFPELHGRGAFPDEATLRKYKPEFRAFCEEMRAGDGFWSDKLIQEEVDALVEEGRLMDWTHTWTSTDGWKEKPGGKKAHTPTAAQVNAEQNNPKPAMLSHGHDSINHSIAVRTRCNRFGIPVECEECKGKAYLYTAPKGTLGLTLWFLHPRKGAARGIEIKSIEEGELKAVYSFLAEGAERNAQRFLKVVAQIQGVKA